MVDHSILEREVAEYLEEEPDRVESVEDPLVDGVYALRVRLLDGRSVEFLRHADGELEDVEFGTWPPTSEGQALR